MEDKTRPAASPQKMACETNNVWKKNTHTGCIKKSSPQSFFAIFSATAWSFVQFFTDLYTVMFDI